jgi:hypothetical protein
LLDDFPSRTTCCILLHRNDPIHFKMVSLMTSAYLEPLLTDLYSLATPLERQNCDYLKWNTLWS